MSSAQKTPPDAARVFADFALALDYDAIPADVVACTKKLILDQLGVMLVGASATGVPELAASVRQSGGAPESSVIGYGFKAPAAQAAMVNGAMADAGFEVRTAIMRLYFSFRGGDRPKNAEDLDYDDILVTKLHGSQFCDLDIVQTYDRSGHFWNGFVSLGEFVPYRRVAKVAQTR